MEITFIIIGLIIGCVLGYFIAGRKAATLSAELKNREKEVEDVKVELQRQLEMQKQNAAEREKLLIQSSEERINREQHIASERIADISKQSNERLKAQEEQYAEQFKTQDQQYNTRLASQEKLFNERLSETNKLYEDRLREQQANWEERLKQQVEEAEAMHKRMTNEFENLSNRIFQTKSEDFRRLNKDHLDQLLQPLTKDLKDFRSRVDEVYDKEAKERFSLENEVKKLMDLNHKISEDANNLTRALKGDSKAQGNWGEMILERLLEASGLIEGEHFTRQEFLKNEQGETLTNEIGRAHV